MFYLQDPTYDHSAFLGDLLQKACADADEGGGVYAFASKSGVELLLGSDAFAAFLARGRYELIVGMDDITDTAALTTLARYEKRYRGRLTVKVYVHDDAASTFHPKYSWFAGKDGGAVVVGSGNLTGNAMKKNREAYAAFSLSAAEIAAVREEWRRWLVHSAAFLFDVDSDVAAAKARQNESRRAAVAAAKSRWLQQNDHAADVALLRSVYRKQAAAHKADVVATTRRQQKKSDATRRSRKPKRGFLKKLIARLRRAPRR